jgi:hypothetical protein
MQVAEHEALEDEVVKQALVMQDKEVEHFVTKCSLYGSQAMIVATFLGKTVANMRGSYEEVDKEYKICLWVFLSSAATAMASCIYSVATTTHGVFWAKSLALRGEPGSVQRASVVMKEESDRISRIFVFGGLCSFAVHMCCAFFLLTKHVRCDDDERFDSIKALCVPCNITSSSTVTGSPGENCGSGTLPTTLPLILAALLIVMMTFTYVKAKAIHEKFKFEEDGSTISEMYQNLFQNPADGLELTSTIDRHKALLLSDNGLLRSRTGDRFASGRNSSMHGSLITRSGLMGSVAVYSKFDHEGYLYKRGDVAGALGVMFQLGWKKRYFVLRGRRGILYNFVSREAYELYIERRGQAKKPKRVVLRDYSIMVKNSAKGSVENQETLVLESLHSKSKDRHFRTVTDAGMDEWVRALYKSWLINQ